MSVVERPDASRELLPGPEVRIASCRITNIEVRDATGNGDGAWTMSGYAAVFNTDTVLHDSNYFRVVESIDPNAFTNALASPDLLTHFNFGHDMNRVMASTQVPRGQIGSLTLQIDPQLGLYYMARVDPEDPDALSLAVKMRNGYVNQASFAFTIARQSTTTTDLEDGREQDEVRILEVGTLFDVCACAQGAYPTATSNFAARTYGAAILGHPALAGATHDQPVRGREDVIAVEAGVPASTRVELAKAKARAITSRTLHPAGSTT